MDEAERSLHDAIMVVKDVLEEPAIVAGGGAPEAEAASKPKGIREKVAWEGAASRSQVHGLTRINPPDTCGKRRYGSH